MFKNAKISSKFKLWYAITTAIVLLSAIILTIFGGFNKGLEFTGGQTITVNTGAYLIDKDSREQVSKLNNDFFAANGIKAQIEQFSPTESLITYKFAFKVNNKAVTAQNFNLKAQEVAQALQEHLELKIGADNDNAFFDVATYSFNPIFKFKTLLLTGVSIAAFLVVVLVYLLFRVKAPAAFATVVCALHDILLLFALIGILRIKLSPIVTAAVLTTIMYTVTLNILLFVRTRSIKKSDNAPKDVCELADNAVKTTIKRNIIVGAIFVCLTVAMAIVAPAGITSFVLPILVGAVVSTYSSMVIAPTVWAQFEKASNKIKSSNKYIAKKAAKAAEIKKQEESA